MTDRTRNDTALAPLDERPDDLELITSFLNGQLDPDRVEQVRQRLEDDPEFRDLAAPMLLTWSVPPHHERHPRPAGEIERHWDEFTRRAGFAHQKRKAHRRRLRLLGLAIIVLGIAGAFVQAPLREWYSLKRDFAVVPYRAGWISLGDSVFVQPDPDASLRVAREPVNDVRHVLLSGSARFRILATDSATLEPRRDGILVRTRGGVVQAGESEFTVSARADTTDVELLRPNARRFIYFIPMPTAIYVRRDTASDPVELIELDRARLIRGERPTRLNTRPKS